ncbi:MAG: hypothetical protein IPH31_02385 [Lewinellaceae bacterium]|nr:hypothetical protein [Lewinellaceae bacterium]
MPRNTRFSIAKKDIVAYFDEYPQKVFRAYDISLIYEQNRENWRLAKSMSLEFFIQELIDKTKLEAVELFFPGSTITLFVYGEASPYELALALRRNAYFSHYTALYFHQLTEQLPKSIYVTIEQSQKHFIREPILQENIDKAFAKPQRVSENHANYGDYTIYLLNGMYTKNEGVEILDYSRQGKLPMTNLERTLIDCAVRPAYSGGVGEVLKAFRNARDKASINKLNAILKKLDFIYPYHQIIGFYLERADYRGAQLDLLKKKQFNHDFYLTYNIEDREYSSDWRLYYPKGF